jgi:L1 cell adhesion molecule like protein
MKIQNDYIIGIDLGTTNSCSAMFINNKLEVIPDKLTGQRIIPSAVCYMENQILVGKLALQKQIEYSQSTIFQSQRYIGHLFKDEEVQYDLKHRRMYVTITEDEKTKKAMYVVKIGDEKNKKHLLPEDVVSEIIKYIKENAENYLKNILHKKITIQNAVITVPAYFTDYRINAVKEAFKNSKLDVVNVIKEPEAIGIAYGYFHKKDKLTTIFIIDIGGGTFGMSILKIQGETYEFIDSEGSDHLGGDYFEKELRDYIVDQIEKQKKINLDFSKDKIHKDEKWVRVLLKIKEETSRVISELSKQKNVKFEIKQLDGKNDFAIDISQEKYKELTKGLLDKCKRKITILFERVNKKNKINYNNIDEIILVGGTTRAPNIQEILGKLFPKKPIFQNLNADEVVAQGAAISAMKVKK